MTTKRYPLTLATMQALDTDNYVKTVTVQDLTDSIVEQAEKLVASYEKYVAEKSKYSFTKLELYVLYAHMVKAINEVKENNPKNEYDFRNALSVLTPDAETHLNRIQTMVKDYKQLAYANMALTDETTPSNTMLELRYSETFKSLFKVTLQEVVEVM